MLHGVGGPGGCGLRGCVCSAPAVGALALVRAWVRACVWVGGCVGWWMVAWVEWRSFYHAVGKTFFLTFQNVLVL